MREVKVQPYLSSFTLFSWGPAHKPAGLAALEIRLRERKERTKEEREREG
jgi:hypothetical protein